MRACLEPNAVRIPTPQQFSSQCVASAHVREQDCHAIDPNPVNKPEKQLDYLHNTSRTRRWHVLITVTVVLLVAVLGKLHHEDWHIDKLLQLDKRIGELFLSLSLGVAGSMLAALFFLSAQEREDARSIKRMQNLTNPEFLNTFLQDLEHFDGKICSDYDVNISLHPIEARSDLIHVRLSYKYKKMKPQRHLRFKITRIQSDSDGTAVDHNHAFYSHELYFCLDERTIRPQIREALYTVDNLIINNQFRPVLTRINPEHAAIHFEADIPQEVSINKPVTIAYRVEFPMEFESILCINTELPTHRLTVNLDYTALLGRITVYNQGFISRCFGPNDMNDHAGPGKITFNYGDWMLPKNGIVFAWWKEATIAK